MLYYLNEYIVNGQIKYKIVKNPNVYNNWELIDTYILYKGKFITIETFRKIVKIKSKQSMFKKLLAFFNKLWKGGIKMTEAQTTSLSSAVTTAAGSVLDNFIAILPSLGAVIAIAFVIYFVTRIITKLRKGK